MGGQVSADLHGAKLPDGWRFSISGGRPHLLEIQRRDPLTRWPGRYATIDFQRRIFGGGSGPPQTHAGKAGYAGRGWKKKIIEDACAWLHDAMQDEP